MKLYEVPRNSKIRIIDQDIIVPPISNTINPEDILEFKKLDGMYSYCYNSKGEVVHPAAFSKVEIIK